MTEGLKSTEFWFAVLVVLAATVLRVTHNLDAAAWENAVKWVGGAYILGRSALKGVDKIGSVRATRLLSELDTPPEAKKATPRVAKRVGNAR